MVALSVFSLASCSGENEIDEKGAPTIVINSKDIQLPAKGGESSFLVDSDVDFIVSVSHDWVSVSKDGNLVKVAAEKNSSLQGRYAELSVSNGKDGASIVINQLGYISSDVEFDDISVSYLGQFVELEYDYDDFISASTDVDWIILDNSRGAEGQRILRVNIGENKTESPRSATIEWTLGLESGSFVVKQRKEMKEYSVNNSWNISYLGSDNDIYKVGVAGVSGEYVVTAVPASKLAQGGFSNVAEYLTESDSDIAKAIADGEIAVYSGDQTVELSNLSGGENYAVVLGYKSSKSELTGEYNVVTFKVEGPDLRTPYEKWLGTWEIERESEIDVWTISKNVENVSYTILGVDGTSKENTPDVPVIAEFDSETGNLIIKAQHCGTFTSSSYGEADLSLYGLGPEYYYTYSGEPYTIATLSLSGKNSANLTPGTVKSGSVTLVSMFILIEPKSGEGKYVFDQNINYSFPCTLKQLTQEGGSGGGEDPNPGNGSYAGWLGNWSYSSDGGDYKVTISQKSAGSTYTITGFTGDYPIEAGYDAATNGLFINGAQLLDSDIQLDNGVVVDLYLFAKDSENYIEIGNPGKNYRIVLGKLGADGKTATFVGDEYDAVYNGETWHEIIVKFGVVGMSVDEDVWTLGDYPLVDVPGTLTKMNAGVSRKVFSAGITARCSLEAAPSSHVNNKFHVESLCKIRVK